MLLSRLPDHVRAFCDANILTYAFLSTEPLSPICLALMERCARREVQLFTSAVQAAHTIHRIMVREAILVFGLEPRKAVLYLKQHPDAVRALTRYKQIPAELSRVRIHILDVTYREIHTSKHFRDEYGLLTDDSITLAIMRRHGLTNLVSNDGDFERVPDIRLWMPD
jgi:predicted nucleic acid-binding protein